MPGQRIFISYRRTDQHDSVGRLRDRLREYYGDNAIFRDIDSIPKGTRFADVIMTELARCEVQLVVIGPHWLDATDAQGRQRLFLPEDWVRTEIEQGLARTDIRIVPVLVGGAALPTPAQLPESIRGLLGWNAAALLDDTFDHDFDVLTHDLGGIRRSSKLLAAAGLVAVLVLALGAGLLLTRSGGDEAEANAGAQGRSTTGGGAGGPAAPKPMTGSFNVAVADFTSSKPADAEQKAQARLLATRLTDRLDSVLGGATGASDIQIRGPDTIAPLSGTTAAQRRRAAEKIADQLNADVVIDGSVDFGDPSSIKPAALLDPSGLADSPELGGYYELGTIASPGSFTNQLTREALVDNLTDATEALAQFIRGVSYYSILDADTSYPARAEQAFTTALASPALPVATQEGSHAFLGSLALLRSDLSGAKTQFDAAVGLNADSTRGQLGLAEVQLLQSVGRRCRAGTVDREGLVAAAAAFSDAVPRGQDESGASLKADLGQARALQCRGQAGEAVDDAAIEKTLDQVIAAAEDERRFTELVADAHAVRALTVAPLVGVTDPRALEASLAETRLAVSTTGRAKNKAVYLWQEAFYLEQLGRSAEANQALASAAQLDPAFAAVTLADLTPQLSGRVVPDGSGAPASVSSLAVLPFTGSDLAPLAFLGLGLLALGAALTALARRSIPG